MNRINSPHLTLIPLMEASDEDTAPQSPHHQSLYQPIEAAADSVAADEAEWITMTAAALLIGVEFNDMVIAVHNQKLKLLESRKEGSNRLVRRVEVLEKADQLKNLPVVRRPNRRQRGRKTSARR